MFLILCIFVFLINCNPLPLFSTLDVYNNLTSHAISGSFCVIFPGSDLNCGTGYASIDVINSKYKITYTLFSGGNTGESVFLYLNNASYTWGDSYPCFIINGFNFSLQANNYKNAKSLPGSYSPGISTYTGLASDGPSCGKNEELYFQFHNNMFKTFKASVNININNECVTTSSIWNYNIETVEFPPFDDDEFSLRSDCYNNPFNYCATNQAC